MTNFLSSVPNISDRVLILSALFEGNFSIDWVVDLTGEKVSQILAALEEGTKKRVYDPKANGNLFFRRF